MWTDRQTKVKVRENKDKRNDWTKQSWEVNFELRRNEIVAGKGLQN